MKHNKFTVVLQSDGELDPTAMQSKMQSLISALVKDLPGMKLSGASMIDVILLINAVKAYLSDANQSLLAGDGAAVLITASGTHFWQFAGDYWANSNDLLKATALYHTLDALQLAEGVMDSPT